MSVNNRPEVLAPAGSPEAMRAAVRSGADAVYFGAGAHNARLRTSGFAKNEIFEAAEYCRIRGVRAFLTLNTLIADGEMPEALDIFETACAAGIDGVIVQDLGFAALARQSAPEMPLHASTQMSVHTPSGVRLLAELGFSRVVLARELSRRELAEIADTARECGIELEVFVHGALCMSVSGQCGISAALGSRSGNRGLCAGTCRLPFSGGRGEYSLSLKDLCLLPYISELCALGIHSLKIEGRQKPPEYSAAAAAVYRNAVDGTGRGDDTALLEGIFTRGFTAGYYTGKTGAEMFGRRREDDFINSGEVLKAAHQLYRHERRSVPVTMRLELSEGAPALLTAGDGVNIIETTGDIPAKTVIPLTLETAERNLTKTGGTPYFVTGTELENRESLSLAPSSLNTLRRNALDGLTEKRRKFAPVSFNRKAPETTSLRKREKPLFWAVYRGFSQYTNTADFSFVPLNSPDDFFISNKSAGAEIPRGMFSLDDYILRRLREIGELGVRDVLCHNPGAVYLARAAGMNIHLGFGMNIYNSLSFTQARELGARSATASTELSCRDISKIVSPIQTQVLVYGHLPVMLTRNCPVARGGSGECAECSKSGFLRDRRGEELPVYCGSGCCEVYNPHVLWTADRLPELSADIYTLQFTAESSGECADIINKYRAGADPAALRAPRKYTRGAYFR